MNADYDFLIAGGGHNGLACGAVLARAGVPRAPPPVSRSQDGKVFFYPFSERADEINHFGTKKSHLKQFIQVRGALFTWFKNPAVAFYYNVKFTQML